MGNEEALGVNSSELPRVLLLISAAQNYTLRAAFGVHRINGIPSKILVAVPTHNRPACIRGRCVYVGAPAAVYGRFECP